MKSSTDREEPGMSHPLKHRVVANIPNTDERVVIEKGGQERLTAPDSKHYGKPRGENPDGDIHERLAIAYSEAAGKPISRVLGKTITFSLTYKAPIEYVSSLLRLDEDRSQAVIDAFWNSNV